MVFFVGMSSLSGAVQISPRGGTFVDQLQITVQAPAGDHEAIVYTTDGSRPVMGSARVIGNSLLIDSSVLLNVALLQSDGKVSDVVETVVFIRVTDEFQSFSSNLPIILLNSGRAIEGTQSSSMTSAECLVFDVDEISARARVDGVPAYAGNSGLRIRGRSSASFPKKQYKFELWTEEEVEQNVNLLGMGGESDWVLSAPYTDKSLMRNLLTFRLWGAVGNTSLDGRFVELFLNSDSDDALSEDDDYLGIYVLTEGITIDDDRVAIDKPEDDGTGSGYIIEMGNADSQEFTTRGSGRSTAFRHKDPNRRDLNSQQRAWIVNQIESFENGLFADDFKDPASGRHYSELTDVDSQVDYKLFREWTRNFDGGSTFFYTAADGALTMGPLWDYNWALGNVNYAEGGDLPGYRTEGWNRSFTANVNGWASWWLRMEEDVDWWQLVADRWFELRNSTLASSNVAKEIDAIADLLSAEAVERNFAKWPVLGKFTVISPPGYRERTTYQSEVDYLKEWIVERMAWMDQQFLAPPVVHIEEVGNAKQVTMQSTEGNVYYTADNSDPRSLGGAISDTAVQFPGGAIDSVLVGEPAPCRYHVPLDGALGNDWQLQDFDDSLWEAASGGIGFETAGGTLEAAIDHNVQAEMLGVNASLYARYSFDIDRLPLVINGLSLSVRYDDSVVVWLNGIEVTRDDERSPAEIEWNSNATGSRRDAAALEWIITDITDFSNLITAGRNVLAVQVMNTSAGSADMMLDVRLGLNQTVVDEPLTIDESTLLHARTFKDDQWSAPRKVYVSVGEAAPNKDNIVVSELMFHPGAPTESEILSGYDDENSFEFIELRNIASSPVSISGLAITGGVQFDFSSADQYSIDAGGYALIVRNTVAFEARYGAGLPVIGDYSGRLSNSGEMIALVDADGVELLPITYDDSWYVDADGSGHSLVLVDDSVPLVDAGNSGVWTSSSEIGGSPGRGENATAGFENWLAIYFTPEEILAGGDAGLHGDRDMDGHSNIMEYVAGSNPVKSDAGLDHAISWSGEKLSFSYRSSRSTNEGVVVGLQTSNDLIQWQEVDGDARVISGDRVKVDVPVSSLHNPTYYRIRVEVDNQKDNEPK